MLDFPARSENATPTRQTPPRDRARAAAVCALLALGTFAAYLPVRHFEYVAYDDPAYVTQNPAVQAGLTSAGVKWAFTTGHAGNWHPLTWLSHMLDVQLFGPSPASPHVVNVLLHIANVLLTFVVLRRLTGALWRSAMVAAVFALHPLHVESVAWVTERKDVLSGFFFLLTLWAYARYVGAKERQSETGAVVAAVSDRRSDRSSAAGWYSAALFVFALGLMAKPMLVTLPCVLLLLDVWPLARFGQARGRNVWPLVLEKLPFFALAVASCAMTFVVQRRGGAVLSLAHFPVGERIANAIVSFARYLGKIVWPVDLAVFYPHPGHWPLTAVGGAAALVIGLLVSAILVFRRCSCVLIGWLWFFGMLIPTIGLVQVGSQSMADRYAYLPMIGVLIVAAWGLGDALMKRRVPSTVLIGVAVVAIGLCAKGTTAQLAHWRNTETLFAHAAAVTDRNGVAQDKLGEVALARGEIDVALEHFRRAVEYQPSFPEFHNNLGNALWKKNRPTEAIEAYRHALDIDPSVAVTHANIGAVLLETGKPSEARPYFEQALAIEPTLANAQNNLATALIEEGRLDDALVHVDLALRQNPDDANAHNNRGSILSRKNQLEPAIAEFQRALILRPQFAAARTNLGRMLLQLGRFDDGLAELQKAIELEPGLAEAHYRIGSALLQSGRLDDALPYLQRTISLRPDSVQAHNDLGVAFIQKGNVDAALVHFRKAVEIAPDFAEGYSNVGKVLQMQGDWRGAATQYKAALKLEPTNPDTLSSLAWVLATTPDPTLRSGPEAAMLAQRANQHTSNQQPVLLRTLAAAYAEVGRFPEAISTVQRAMNLARERNDPDLFNLLRSDLAVYADGAPLRDTSASRASDSHAPASGK